ncbi:hypothetical protein R0G64_31955, partial [Pseudomonas otitidis]|nr:hypothetical protein [Pseudomonas otitidis]
AERQLAELVENQLQERVRYWLALRLERGDCTLAACAPGQQPQHCHTSEHCTALIQVWPTPLSLRSPSLPP